MHYFFKNLPLYSEAWFRQTKCILVMMSKDSIPNYIIIHTKQGFLCWDMAIIISHLLKMQYRIYFPLLLIIGAWIRQIMCKVMTRVKTMYNFDD